MSLSSLRKLIGQGQGAGAATFTAHNIRLDDGTFTKPDATPMDQLPWFLSARRILTTVFPNDREKVRLADLGCLEGGYSVEFARLGFSVTGLEVRESNFAACKFVKSKTDLPNLTFVKDNAWNLPKYGKFDGVFCCGLLYHLDEPRKFIEMISSLTNRIAIFQTHFAATYEVQHPHHNLSPLTTNEGVPGRWFAEFTDKDSFRKREDHRWSSWDNTRSFWIQREYLIQTIRDAGFDLVLEQFDGLGDDIAKSMTEGYYHTDMRGTFIGIKTQG